MKLTKEQIVPPFMPQIIAHRGASGEAPENTLSAIQRAISLEADFVEIDVHLTKDGIPVVIHDGSIPRKISEKSPLPVNTLKMEEIKKFDAGSWFNPAFANERIPSLKEVLSLSFDRSSLMIEIKHEHENPKKITQAVFNVIESFPKLPSIIIGSFSLEVILESKRFPVLGIVEKLEMIDFFIKSKIRHLAISDDILSGELIRSLVAQNLRIWVFTVNTSARAKWLVSQGVDGIITNCPRKLMLIKSKN